MAIKDWFSDKLQSHHKINWNTLTNNYCKTHLFIAFNISIVTNTDRAMVIGWGSVNTLQSIPLNSGPLPEHCKWWVCSMCHILVQSLFALNWVAYQLVVAHLWSFRWAHEPPSGSTYSGGAYVSSNSQVSRNVLANKHSLKSIFCIVLPEEQPSGNKRFISFTGRFAHNV